MENIFQTITNWPVIVQGALGSALFWIILKASIFTSGKLSSAYGNYNSKAKNVEQIQEYYFLKYISSDDSNLIIQGHTFCTRMALSRVMNGLIFISIGLTGR